MTDRYMVFVPGSTEPPKGPLDEHEIRLAVAAGSIPQNARASKIGGASWIAIMELVESTSQPKAPEPKPPNDVTPVGAGEPVALPNETTEGESRTAILEAIPNRVSAYEYKWSMLGLAGGGLAGYTVAYSTLLDEFGRFTARIFWSQLFKGSPMDLDVVLRSTTFWELFAGVVVGAITGYVIATRINGPKVATANHRAVYVPVYENPLKRQPGTHAITTYSVANGSIPRIATISDIDDSKEVTPPPSKPPEPEPMYEVTVDGETIVGPVTREQLERGIEAGKVPQDAKARKKGETAWRRVQDVLHSCAPVAAPTVGAPRTADSTRFAPPRSRRWPLVGAGIGITAITIGILFALGRDPTPEQVCRHLVDLITSGNLGKHYDDSECVQVQSKQRADDRDAWLCDAKCILAATKLEGIVGCSKRCSNGAARTGAAPHRGATASTSSSSARQLPAPTPQTSAADVLREHPDFLLDVPVAWNDRVVGTATEDLKSACPKIAAFQPKDEFERQEETPKLAMACKDEMTPAMSFAKTCPWAYTLKVEIGEYDFTAKAFHLHARHIGDFKDALVTQSSRTYFGQQHWLVTWPGAIPAAQRRGETVCIGPLYDQLTVNAGLNLDLHLAVEEAKTFKGALALGGDPAIQVAVILDGGKGSDPLLCDSTTPDGATGRVVAWRVVDASAPKAKPLIDWMTSGAWESPPSCDDARRFFDIPETTGTSGRAGGSDPAMERVPPTDWSTAHEILLKGSSALHCSTKRLDDWLRIWCQADDDNDVPTKAVVTKGAGPDVIVTSQSEGVMLTCPYVEGTDVEADFTGKRKTHKLIVRWPMGSPRPKIVGEFVGAPSRLDFHLQ